MNGILIIAHAPIASALRAGALHVFPDAASSVAALDVPPDQAPEQTLADARALAAELGVAGLLVLTDLFGATPCNVASRLVDGIHSRLLTGVNLPMLVRAISYRQQSLEALVTSAMMGGTQGVIPVSVTAPQNQQRKQNHDQDHRDHQQ